MVKLQSCESAINVLLPRTLYVQQKNLFCVFASWKWQLEILYLMVQFLETRKSKGEDGARAGSVANGLIPVFYRSETWPQLSEQEPWKIGWLRSRVEIPPNKLTDHYIEMLE